MQNYTFFSKKIRQKNSILAFFFISLLYLNGCVQNSPASISKKKMYNTPTPKHEVRAVWVVTLNNKDFPSKKGLSIDQQKKEWQNLLNYHQKKGINTIIFQVRSAGDALYNSPFEPWAEWITGTQGKGPEYDLLEYVITETHKRNMEFHAWFNPYRAIAKFKKTKIAKNHVTKIHPEWCIPYHDNMHLNPALPEVRAYIANLVMDLVRKYDVDGVHFDDYFYPYKVEKKEFDDNASFILYKGDFKNKADWRRNNVDLLIKSLHDSLEIVKPHIKFGISPIGVWRNKKDDKRGSDSDIGQPCYDMLYADVRKWLEKGWIDYVAPQLYWHNGHPKGDFQKLLTWWADNSFGKHLYIGHASYKIRGEDNEKWANVEEINQQIYQVRKNKNVKGSVFFCAKSFMANYMQTTDTLHKHFYKHIALIPSMPWKDDTPPNSPKNMRVQQTPYHLHISWEKPFADNVTNEAKYYGVYKIPNYALDSSLDVKYLVKIQKQTFYFEKINEDTKKYRYIITAFDRLHNESQPTETKITEINTTPQK